MKKLLLFVSFFALTGYVSAQCTPDMSVAGDAGIHPDSATNFAPAYVGTPYGQVVTAVVPVDTCAQVLPLPLPCSPLTFDSVVVRNVTGLPPGFLFTCAPAGCRFLGNTIDCAIITGTAQPGDEGVYDLVFEIDAYVGGFGIPNSYTIEYYKIAVLPAVGIDESQAAAVFSVKQNQPNPFDAFSSIEFECGLASQVRFDVFNLLGQPVYSKSISAAKGKNTLQFDGTALPAGTYLYKLSDGNKTITRKMLIAR